MVCVSPCISSKILLSSVVLFGCVCETETGFRAATSCDWRFNEKNLISMIKRCHNFRFGLCSSSEGQCKDAANLCFLSAIHLLYHRRAAKSHTQAKWSENAELEKWGEKNSLDMQWNFSAIHHLLTT